MSRQFLQFGAANVNDSGASREATTPYLKKHNEWLAMEREYEAGSTLVSIAKNYGVSPTCVSYRLRRLGVTLRQNPRSRRPAARIEHISRDLKGLHDSVMAMKSEYEAGDSLAIIAERYGVTRQCVHQRLKKYGVTFRPPGSGAHRHPKTAQRSSST